MDYYPKGKNKNLEHQILNGLKRLKTLGKKDSIKEKGINKDSLNKIQLNLQNFISKTLENNSNETKYFNINQEIEEIEKIKKNKLKEEESFEKLKNKIPFNEQFFPLTLDDSINNTNNLIGLNNFKHNKKVISHNNLIGVNNIISKNNQINNILLPKQKYSFDFSNKNIDKLIQLKLKKKNSSHNNDKIISSKILDSPISKKINRLSYNESLKSDNYPLIDKDLKIKKKKLKKYSSAPKINFPVKKQFSDNIQKYNLISKKDKNKLKKIHRRNREKSQIINKKKVYLRLMEKNKDFQNERKKIFSTTLSKDINDILNKRNTYIPNYTFSKDLLLTEIYTKDENDIRNILNLTLNEYNEFSKCCDSIKESFLSSPKKGFIKKNKSLSSLKKIENIINDHNINFKQNKTINEINENKNQNLIPLIEKKKFLEEEEINSSDIIKNKMNIKEFKELQYRHLIKSNKLVYDSLSDEESDIEFDDTFYIDPKSKFKFYFDLILFLITWYNLIIPPINICFYPKKYNYYYSKSFIMTIIIHIYYIIDLFLGFFTAYYDIEERLIKKNTDIIINYLSKWFILDLISSFPYFIINLKSISQIDQSISINEFKVIYLIELIPLIKFFKIYKHNIFFFRYKIFLSKQTSLSKISQTLKYIVIFILCGHIFACIFIFLSHLEYPSWVSIQNLSNSPKFEIYISSFYYVFTTVFTVGYGDIVSINIYERVFNLILLIFGIMVYSFSISSLSNYVQKVDYKTQDYNKKMEILQHLKLTHEKLSPILYEKISRFLKYRLTHISKDKNEIIDNLPIGLKTRLIMEMYKPIIDNFIFFKTYNSSDFIIRVILAFRPIITMKNEKLVNEGDYLEEIIFVKRGILSLELPLPILINEKDIEDINYKYRKASILNMEFPHSSIKKSFTMEKPKIIDFNNDILNKKTVTFIRGKGLSFNNNNDHFIIPIQQYVKIIEIRKNEHFGDILMFLNRRSPLSMKVKSKVAELFLLNKTDAVEISMNFPKIWSLIIKKSLFNMEQIERLINKALKFFFSQNKGKKQSKRESYSQYYQKDFSKKNIFVNCNEIYSSLSSEDCQLKSIPSVTEVNDNSDKNTMLLNSEKDKNNFLKNKNSNNIDSDNKSNSNNNKNNSFNENNEKNSNLIKSNSSSDSIINENENNKINNNISNIKILNKEKNENKEIILNILNNNEIIKEENSDEEKESIIQKKTKIKNSIETERKNISTKKPTNGSNEYSDSDSNFFNSSSDYQCKSKTETEKEKLENNYFNLSTFSSNNNSLIYPFLKEEINNEEYPFENNDISNFLKNNSFNRKFKGIVPKDFIIEKYLRSKFLIKSKDDSQKEKININDNYSSNNNNIIINNNNSYIKEKEFIFTNLSTTSFNFQIESLEKNNEEILLIPSPKEKIELFIIKNESFTINQQLLKKKITSISETNLPMFKKTFTASKLKEEINNNNNNNNNNKEDVTRTKTDKLTFQRKNIINKTVKVKNDRRMSKIILNPKTYHFFDNGRKQFYGNDEKLNMPLFSESTLDLIGENIKSTSLALNNPKMFYTNYFNKVVEADTNERKTFSFKLKEIEKMIHNGKNKSLFNNLDIDENNSSINNSDKKSK